jgi:hypothetical protein
MMLASVLNSPVAVQASIYVVRAFVQMRAAVQEYAELSRRIDELAANCDDQFQEIFDAIRQLMGMPATPARPTGFIPTGRERRKGIRFCLARRTGPCPNPTAAVRPGSAPTPAPKR